MATLSGTYTSGITLVSNPTTIAPTGNVGNSAASGAAVSGPFGTTWTLANQGLVTETGTSGIGVSLASGGTVANANSAVISANTIAVYIASGAGSVSNAGSITGTSGFGIRFGSSSSGGTVTNQTGGVIAGGEDAIYFNTGAGAGTVSNSGSITGGTSGFAGINLSGGGSVSNATGGTITGQQAGVFIANGASATVTNAGSIGANQAYGIWLLNAGSVTNASGGHITASYGTANAAGVYLGNGGSVTNQAGGTIGGLRGVYVLSGAATVVNAGDIIGSNTVIGAGAAQTGAGVYLGAGGSVTNQAGGTLSGYDGVWASGAAATVVNAGVITGNTTAGNAAGVSLAAGGSVTNQSTGTITAYNGVEILGARGTVLNLGLIDAADVSDLDGLSGVKLQDGGLITNGASGGTASTATILGYAFAGSGAVNLGSSGTGTLVNFGTVRATTGNTGVIATNATVINGASGATGALIAGGEQGNGIEISGSGTVINYATISAVTPTNTNQPVGFGVSVGGGGTISNLGSLALIQTYLPVYAAQGATVINAGTVISQYGAGTGKYAVLFGGGTNRLIIDPGAVFIGTVRGSSPAPVTLAAGVPGASVVVATAAGTTTLELASAMSAGTLSGLGTQFVGFAQTTVDAGANWILSGANTVVAATPLTNSGTLTDTGTLVNAGTITGNPVRLNGGTLTNQTSGLITASYVYGVPAGGADSVVNQGTIINSAGSAIYLKAAGNVSNAAGGLLSGGGIVVKQAGTGATLSNLGKIISTGTTPGSYGVYLRNGGLVTNGQAGAGTSTATIQGYYGVAFKSVDSLNKYGTLQNYGTVRGIGLNAAVSLANGGTVFNGQSGATGALIEGYRYGVSSNVGTVVNAATIIGTGTQSGDYGIAIQATGSVSNLGTAALIEGYVGVLIGLDGTVINSGTIESNQGSNGTAVKFTGGNALLIDDPTGIIIGGIYGGSGGSAVLELASGSSAGTITGLGTSITNFTSLVFDSGADWTVEGNDSANGLGTLGISGFSVGDTIVLTNFIGVNRTFTSNSLTIGDGIGDYETLHLQGSFSTANFQISNDGSGGTDITLLTPPSIASGGTVGFTGGGSAVTLDPGLTVTDPESTTLVSGTVSFGSGFEIGDTLNFTAEDGIIGSYDAATGTLSLSGGATVADYQAALDSITYSFAPSDGDPTGGGSDTSRTIDWTVNDGTVTSATSTSTLDITHVAPTVTASGTVTFVAGGSAVALDPTLSLSDVDSGGLLNGGTVSIGGFVSGDILSADTTGLPAITTSYNAATGVLTLSGSDTLADYQAVLDSITYSSSVSDPTVAGADPTRTISWSVSDGAATSGAATTTVDVTLPPPAITGTVAGQVVNDDATDDPFSAVTITDPNPGATETVTITLTVNSVASDANGVLSGTGLSKTGVGTYSLTAGTPAAVTALLDALVFTPTQHEVTPGATVTTGMTLSVSNGIDGTPTTNGTTSVITTAVATPPSITGALANQGVPNETPGTPFSTVTLVDPNIGGTDTVTVTMSAPGNGTFSNLGSGSYDAATGVYSVSGATSAVTAALDALVFTPIAQANADVTTTQFTIDPGNGGASNSTTSVTSVQQVAGLASVPTGQIAISVSPDGSSFAPAQSGKTNEAVVSDPAENATYSVPTGYQALFAGGTADVTLSDTAVGNAILVANQGNDELIAGAPNDILVAGSGNDSLVGGAYADTVMGGVGVTTVFAGSGAMHVVEGSGLMFFSGSSNAGSTISGGTGALVADLTGSHQTAELGSGPATITAAGSGNDVVGGPSTLTATITGSGDTVQAGSGSNTVTSAGSGDLILGSTVSGAGALVVSETGTNDTIQGGANPTTVTASSATQVYGGSGSLSFVGGAGLSTVFGGTGADSVTAGAGGVIFNVDGVNDATVNSGTGAVTVFGSPNTAVNLTGSSGLPDYVVAGAGNETLNASGSSSSNWLSVATTVSSAGSVVMVGGAGNDTLVAGGAPGSEVMTGGGGDNAFVFFKQAAGGAADIITDFNANDAVYIENYAPGSASALQAASTVTPGGLMLTLSDGTTITFSNLTNASALNGKIQYG